MSGLVQSIAVRSGPVRSGRVGSGPVRSGPSAFFNPVGVVRPGSVWSGTVQHAVPCGSASPSPP
eukprot:11495773-Alexandrium_andersonii.AAC.1